MPRLVVARTPSEMEPLRGLWDDLQARGRCTLFQSFEWNLLAARAFGAREAPYVLAAENAGGAVIVPAAISPTGLSFLGESLFDYRDLLAQGDMDTQVWKELSRFGQPLQVTALRGREVGARWRALGLPVALYVGAPRVLRSEMDGGRFEARHAHSKRLARRLARLGVTFHQHPGTDAALVRHLYQRKARQALAGGENLFADPARREFLVAAAALGSCDVYTLESAGALVAALVTFRDGAIRRFYTTYFDPAWAHCSPGVTLLLEVTRRTLAEGFDCDYMTGEQPHKLRFATSSVPLYRVQASAAELAAVADGEKLAA